MEYGYPPHAARALETCRHPPDSQTVSRGKGSALSQRCLRHSHRYRRRTRRRTGSQVDPGKGRKPQTGKAAVDLICHRQSHPGGLCPFKTRQRLRKPVSRGSSPGRGRLGRGHQRHTRADMQIQRPAFLWPRTDSDACHDSSQRGRNPKLRASDVLRTESICRRDLFCMDRRNFKIVPNF